MKRSVIVSAGIHAAILGAALFSLPSSEEFKVEQLDAVQVDISQITDQSKRKAATTEDLPKVEKPAPKKVEVPVEVKPAPKVAEEVKTAAREPVAEEKPEPKKEEPKKEEPPPEPKPEPKKAEDKPLDSDPLEKLLAEEAALKKVEEKKKADEEKKKAEELKKKEDEKKKLAEDKKKKAEEKKLAEKKKKKAFDDIAAFLNKEEGEQAAPQKPSDITGSPDKAEKSSNGTDDALAATIVDALRQRLSECWSVPPGARDANILVKVRFALNPDGSVNGAPTVVNDSADPLFGTTAQSAVSAVMECQNYDFLPPEKFDVWKTITITFNPNMMFG
jgi:TolA protein